MAAQAINKKVKGVLEHVDPLTQKKESFTLSRLMDEYLSDLAFTNTMNAVDALRAKPYTNLYKIEESEITED